MIKRFLGLSLVFAALSAAAQTDDIEWQPGLRPMHCDAVTVEDGRMPATPRRIGSQASAPMKALGVQYVPVVLVNFADKRFTAADSTDEGVRDFYQLYCNGTKDGKLYTGHGSYGAVRDYFVQQSDSLLFPEFVVIGPVTLEGDCATYGRNEGDTHDVGYNAFCEQSIRKAMEIYSDWDRFDNNGNGDIDMVFFVYAGMGENSGGDADCIWPKEMTSRTTINGRVFACNAACNETRPGKSDAPEGSTRTDGIGPFIHELSHVLGLPDFYDYDVDKRGDLGFGMDSWSVMDYGAYVNVGYNPAAYTAYERDFMGWRPLQELSSPQVLTLYPMEAGGTGYRITNDANPNEYYIIENRQAIGWDSSLGKKGHGLQVTHVDYSANLWTLNRTNTDCPDHQHMTIIPANNDYRGVAGVSSSKEYSAMLAGHLYPGTSFNFNLTDDTTPAAQVYAGGLLHKPLRNITENDDGTVTVCFMTNGQLEAPVLDEPQDIDEGGFSVSWDYIDGATNYICALYSHENLVRCDTVETAEMTYTDLVPDRDYSVCVKARADQPEDYIDSEWSEALYLKTEPDLVLGLDSENKVSIYTMNGTCVARCFADEIGRMELRRGIYILKYDRGGSRKILL
ncbi:MAG: M6 family metalloprotease domain-containing protein [Bacteroidaceae bacterium]|nr:M6 family metalloprotease domain-containing protein [Bacteroidaceae bacterium]